MQDTRIPKRWAEVQFYYIIIDILQLRNNILDVMQNIDYLSGLGKYNAEAVKEYAQEIIASPRTRPTKEEAILLCRTHDVPIKTIRQRFTIHLKTLYNLFNTYSEEQFTFYPRFSEKQNEQIQLYVDAVNKLKGVGINV